MRRPLSVLSVVALIIGAVLSSTFLVMGGSAAVAGGAAPGSCSFNGAPSGNAITVVPGTTTVSINCIGLAASTTYFIATASPLAGVVTPSSAGAFLALLMNSGVPPSATSDASGDLSTTVTIPSNTTGTDPDATCPPSQAQVNAGLTNCDLLVASTSEQEFGQALLSYPGQPTPASPTLSLNPATGPSGTALTVTGANWWGNGSSTVSIPASDIQVGGVASTAPCCSVTVPAASYAINSSDSGGTLTGGAIQGMLYVPGGAPTGSQSVSVTEPNSSPMSNPPYTGAGIDGSSSFTVTTPSTTPTPLSITSPTSFYTGTTGINYSRTLSATGGTSPYAWSVTGLPPGVSLITNSNLGDTGLVSGVPTEGGTYSVTITVSDSSTPVETASETLPLTIVVPPPPLAFSGGYVAGDQVINALPTARVGVPYSFSLGVTGGTPPYHWSDALGDPPDGLSLNPTTGEITGIPEASDGGFSTSFIVEVSDSTPAGPEAPLGAPLTVQAEFSITTLKLPPPTTAVVLPSSGATVSAEFLLDASASSLAGIGSVQYDLSGGPDNISNQVIAYGTPTLIGYLAEFDGSTVPNGTYTLTSVATDTQGNSTTSAPVTITITNQPLQTTILVPTTGSSVRNGAVLDASAAGLSPVTSVSFEVTGNGLRGNVVGTGQLTIYGWVAYMDTTGIPAGSYVLNSVAVDSAGEIATSPGIDITVTG
jgi:hypothetical protein